MQRRIALLALAALVAVVVAVVAVRAPSSGQPALATTASDARAAPVERVLSHRSRAPEVVAARRAEEARRSERFEAAAAEIRASRDAAVATRGDGPLVPVPVMALGAVLVVAVLRRNAVRPHDSGHDPTDPRLGS